MSLLGDSSEEVARGHVSAVEEATTQRLTSRRLDLSNELCRSGLLQWIALKIELCLFESGHDAIEVGQDPHAKVSPGLCETREVFVGRRITVAQPVVPALLPSQLQPSG